jgi:hypothetical protein
MLDRPRRRCRQVSTAALEERRDAWRTGGVAVGSAHPKAARAPLTPALPEDGAVHRPVWPDVVPRGDRAFHACLQRIQHGATPGSPRFPGRNRSTSGTAPPGGTGATRDHGVLVRSPLGRSAGG